MSRPKRGEKPFAGNISTPSVAWLSPLDADTTSSSESVVKLVEIHLPQQQPRRYFDSDALKELVSSVRQHGILQPLLVRPLKEGGYELVAGERRYLAATEVGLTEVPVTVRELTNEEAFQFALIENLQRADLTPIEETEGILQLLALHLEQQVALPNPPSQ
jgi:ParB family chromosome partitioning protein